MRTSVDGIHLLYILDSYIRGACYTTNSTSVFFFSSCMYYVDKRGVCQRLQHLLIRIIQINRKRNPQQHEKLNGIIFHINTAHIPTLASRIPGLRIYMN